MQTVYSYQKDGQLAPINRFVLLSTSPRRQELLAFLSPDIQAVDIDERAIQDHFMATYAAEDFLTCAAKTCCEISKAKSDRPMEAGTLYISADTIVVADDKIFNKPQSLEEAEAMLLSYFGKSHHVVTSVCLRAEQYLEVFYTVARIDFVDYYEELGQAVKAYVTEKRPLDKSGAYGIQELDPRFVKGITGDIHTIIGLPVAELSSRLFGAVQAAASGSA